MLYLDYNATSPLHPEVRMAVAPYLMEKFGNASSLHSAGRQARSAIEAVRGKLLSALGDPSGELIFTSGGTEADNLAVKGVGRVLRWKGDHLILSSVEHSAVLHSAQSLVEEGFKVTFVPVNHEGVVDVEALKRLITPQTVLISVMHANNEVGTVQPIGEIAKIAHDKEILFHTDAVQSFGKLKLNVREIGADLVSVSAHKIGGPKGVGALYLRQGVALKPLLSGGPHEHQHRAGTEGVPGIVGMGAALEVTLKEQSNGTLERITHLRDRLEKGLKESVSDLHINGHPTQRLGGTLNVTFLGCSGETLLMAFDLSDICVSTGSACSSGSTQPSHVLVAMGLPSQRIEGSIRFSLGWGTTEEEIQECLRRIPPIVERIRKVEGKGLSHRRTVPFPIGGQ